MVALGPGNGWDLRGLSDTEQREDLTVSLESKRKLIFTDAVLINPPSLLSAPSQLMSTFS